MDLSTWWHLWLLDFNIFRTSIFFSKHCPLGFRDRLRLVPKLLEFRKTYTQHGRRKHDWEMFKEFCFSSHKQSISAEKCHGHLGIFRLFPTLSFSDPIFTVGVIFFFSAFEHSHEPTKEAICDLLRKDSWGQPRKPHTGFCRFLVGKNPNMENRMTHSLSFGWIWQRIQHKQGVAFQRNEIWKNKDRVS